MKLIEGHVGGLTATLQGRDMIWCRRADDVWPAKDCSVARASVCSAFDRSERRAQFVGQRGEQSRQQC
jgi:hypothetical protein